MAQKKKQKQPLNAVRVRDLELLKELRQWAIVCGAHQSVIVTAWLDFTNRALKAGKFLPLKEWLAAKAEAEKVRRLNYQRSLVAQKNVKQAQLRMDGV
jgi:hypothetical protein